MEGTMDAGGQGRGKCYEVDGANWQGGGGMQITEQDRSRAHAWVSVVHRSERFNEIAYAWLKEKLT